MARGGFEMIGVPELSRKLSPSLVAEPVKRFLSRWAIAGANRATELAPVNFGRLRAEIDYDVHNPGPGRIPEWGAFGVGRLHYAIYIEGGTGTQADLPGGSGVPHFPPWDGNLEIWTQRVRPISRTTGRPMTAFQVARAIARRGGLVPRRMFRTALAEIENDRPRWERQLAKEIEAQGGRP